MDTLPRCDDELSLRRSTTRRGNMRYCDNAVSDLREVELRL